MYMYIYIYIFIYFVFLAQDEERLTYLGCPLDLVLSARDSSGYFDVAIDFVGEFFFFTWFCQRETARDILKWPLTLWVSFCFLNGRRVCVLVFVFCDVSER